MNDPKSPDSHCWNAYQGCKTYALDSCMCPCAACVVALGGSDKPRKKSTRERVEDAIRDSKSGKPWEVRES